MYPNICMAKMSKMAVDFLYEKAGKLFLRKTRFLWDFNQGGGGRI